MASAQGDTTGPLLARDKIDRYRPLGAFGRPAYESYVQLRAMLLAKRGPKFANYFAKPNYEAQTRDLRWTAEVPGTARGWHEMAPEEQVQHALELEVVRSGLKSFAQELRAQTSRDAGGSQAFASLLEQALKVPAQGDFLYFIDEQPVIAFWGFETQTGGSIEPGAVAPAYAPAAARAPAAGLATPVAATTAATVATAAGTAVLVRKRPWWWLLLWILFGLLLLLALLWLLRSCTEHAPIGPDVPFADKGGVPPGTTPGDTSVPGQPDTTVTPGDTGTPGTVTQGPDGRPLVPGDGGQTGVDVGRNTNPDAPPDGTGQPPVDGRDVARTDPPQIDTPPDADKQPKGDKPQGPDTLAKKDAGRPLDIPPPDTKSPPGVGFLEGRWKADELADRATGQPLDLSFNFDKQGKGEVTLRRADGSTCKGAVSGTMNGGKLSIEGNQAIPCSNGGAYAPPKIECTKAAGGKTQCFGVNRDGSKYYMGMARDS